MLLNTANLENPLYVLKLEFKKIIKSLLADLNYSNIGYLEPEENSGQKNYKILFLDGQRFGAEMTFLYQKNKRSLPNRASNLFF
jgi:hypothetical protein